MAIQTTNGNTVKFLGISDNIRANLLRAILGGALEGKILVNSSHMCYIGLSSTQPKGDGTNITEPDDWNYKRLLLSKGVVTKDSNNKETNVTFTSDYLSFFNDSTNGIKAENVRKDENDKELPSEIKFNRSTKAWPATIKYFFLTTAKEKPKDSTTESGLLAWGELTEEITVNAKNVVPLFEEGKLRLYFPEPGKVEEVVDAAAAADKEPTV